MDAAVENAYIWHSDKYSLKFLISSLNAIYEIHEIWYNSNKNEFCLTTEGILYQR